MRTVLIIIAGLTVSACGGNLWRPRANYDICQHDVRAAYNMSLDRRLYDQYCNAPYFSGSGNVTIAKAERNSK